MEKIDVRKQLNHLYNPTYKHPVVVEVPAMNFLMIDGEGEPGVAQQYQDAVESIFPLAYAIKFAIKRGATAVEYKVMPLEGLWWADDMSVFTENRDRSQWKWTLLIMQPQWVTADLVAEVREDVRSKKNPPSLERIRFEVFNEGLAAQIMHIGPFSEEGPTIERLHAFIKESGGRLRGLHHEIYLSDIRRGNPEKWKTVIRQPMERD